MERPSLKTDCRAEQDVAHRTELTTRSERFRVGGFRECSARPNHSAVAVWTRGASSPFVRVTGLMFAVRRRTG